MNSKQPPVAAALRGTGYDRLPMWYGREPGTTQNVLDFLRLGSEEELCQYLGIDFRTIRPRYAGPELKRYADGTFDTIWGIRRGGGFWGIAPTVPLRTPRARPTSRRMSLPARRVVRRAIHRPRSTTLGGLLHHRRNVVALLARHYGTAGAGEDVRRVEVGSGPGRGHRRQDL